MDARSFIKDHYTYKLDRSKSYKYKTRIEDLMNRKQRFLDKKIKNATNKVQDLLDIIGEDNIADVMDYVNDNKSFYESANDYIYGRVYY